MNFPPDETIKAQPWLAVPRRRPVRLMQAAQMQGRQEAWSSADKLFLRIVALAGLIST